MLILEQVHVTDSREQRDHGLPRGHALERGVPPCDRRELNVIAWTIT